MKTLNKWIRQIHRWLVIPFVSVIVLLLAGTAQQGAEFKLPDWVSAIALGSLLLLFLSGLYMFAQHYLAKWRRGRRQRSQKMAP